MTEKQTRTSVPAPPAQKRSRTISNLTEKQVRQKREVDRKAQRAFRQRAKDCLANLEQQHRELQETSRETEIRLRRELELLRGQNQRLVRCLANIIQAASTIRNEKPDTAVFSHRNGIASPLSLVEHHPTISRDSISRRSSQNDIQPPETSRSVHDASCSPSSQDAAPKLVEVAILHPEHETVDIGSQERTPTPSYHEQHQGDSFDRLVQPGRASPNQALDSNTLLHAEASNNVDLRFGHDERPDHDGSHVHSLGSHDILLTPIAMDQASSMYHGEGSSTCGRAQGFGSASYESAPFGDSITVGANVPSLHLTPTCHLDQLMLDFIYSQRDMLSQGIPLSSVVGPEKPTVKALINPGFCGPVHGISKVLSGILSTLFKVRQTEKLALFYVMYKLIRWQISRMEEDYQAMPLWLRPTITQATLPHAAWIDIIPWPSVRDILIKDAHEYAIEHSIEYYVQNISVNWKFDEADSLADITGEVLLHSIFEKHVSRLQSWSVSSEFQHFYPNLAQAIHLESLAS